jgi:phage recombination protein Bet
MSTALKTVSQNNLTVWEDSKKLEEIRKIFAPKLNTQEFDAFVGMGLAANLNPFLREIWAVKYQDNAPAQIFVGRDGYRKAAQRNQEYDYHECDAVYSNDVFKRNSISGEINHEYNLKDRGELLGAYCIVKRKNSSRPCYTWVKLSEYSTGKSLWNPQTGKPETMIKKVAECQGLRGAFQDLLGGTYGEEEMGEPREYSNTPKQTKSQELMDKIKAAKGQVIEGEMVETGIVAHEDQLSEIHSLLACKVFEEGRLKGALDHYKVEKLAQLTSAQADDFIGILSKLPDRE